ncbi:hypothetical protein [Clostridium cuniculi]|uniref:hypothetical protein n=1 Tax=Clostridium cuniculi TaxID=2548455 RepID=UPI0018AB9D1E|nr:hypothetical protein [Clostridium cuniculi]
MKKILIMMIISTSVFIYGCGVSKVDNIYKSIKDGDFSKASEIYKSIEDKSEFYSELDNEEEEIITTVDDFIADYLIIEESREKISDDIKTALSGLNKITTELGINEAKTIILDNKDEIKEYINGLNSIDAANKYMTIVKKFSGETIDFSEVENRIAENEAKKKAEEEAEKQKIAEEKAKNEELFNELFWSKTDSITGDVTYYSKSELSDSGNEDVILIQNNVFATEVVGDNVIVMAGFQKEDWCFFESIDYNADGEIGKIEFAYNDVNRQTYIGGIFEIAPIMSLLNKSDLVNIANSEKVTIRFNGDNSYSFDLTEQQIKELRCAMIKTGNM